MMIVFVAPAVDLPIERGIAGPGLLADTAIRRFGDHQPLNRLEKIYAREGMYLPRSTVCGWHERLAALLKVLVEGVTRVMAPHPMQAGLEPKRQNLALGAQSSQYSSSRRRGRSSSAVTEPLIEPSVDPPRPEFKRAEAKKDMLRR